MSQIEIFLYDAFSETLFGGGIAGVVVESARMPGAGLTDASMQSLATELAAPTTGFAALQDDGSWRLRFFTPTQEIDMCGHVVVGVFSGLSDLGLLGDGDLVSTTAQTRAGDIPVKVERTGGHRPIVEMRQLRPRFREVTLNDASLSELLGIQVDDLHPYLPVGIASTGLSHLIVPTRGVEVLARLKPRNAALAELSRTLGVDTIPVVALTGLPDGITVRSRDLCPGIGNAEEAASGTTNGALGCYLVRHGAVVSPVGGGAVEIRAEQGVEMGRPSIIESRIAIGDDGAVYDVRVRGSAVRALAGWASLP